ncbi:hypothetical protein ElyMa_001041700 [Elysia marginata]|uniref:Uncharacterized protein n=1 Tax=Elysia marginata TaxID=1093978 RepID=A0AAV4HRD6_9GAST|nr:hypothetical protein ElyMa_001041700 [Elysia marginata]
MSPDCHRKARCHPRSERGKVSSVVRASPSLLDETNFCHRIRAKNNRRYCELISICFFSTSALRQVFLFKQTTSSDKRTISGAVWRSESDHFRFDDACAVGMRAGCGERDFLAGWRVEPLGV